MTIEIDHLSLDELIELNNRILERINHLESIQAHLDMMDINLGARVTFDSKYGRQSAP